MKAGPPMPMTVDGQRILLASSSGELDRSQVVSVSLSMDQPKAAQSMLLERFGVQDGDAVTGPSTAIWWMPTASRPGQMAGKVSSDEQLKAAAAKEQQQLKTWLAERENPRWTSSAAGTRARRSRPAAFSAPRNATVAGTW
jgi:hypothetical protein